MFDDVHARVIALVRDGGIDGLRLDHIDGLTDPKGYLVRLQAALRENLRRRKAQARERVEKAEKPHDSAGIVTEEK